MKKSFFIMSIMASLVIGLMQTACNSEGICRNGNGTTAIDTLSFPAFTGIKLTEAATVHVKQGAVQEVVFEGDENVIEALDSRVDNGNLIIDVDGCFFSYDLDVYITVPASQPQNNLTVSGSGEILVEDSLFLANDFRAVVSGSGEIELTAANVISSSDITISGSGKMIMDYESTTSETTISGSGKAFLKGKTTDHAIRISGSGDILSFDLVSVNTDITVSGSGDAEIRVEGGTLDARISGSGDILYKGNPAAVNTTITGSGSIEKVN